MDRKIHQNLYAPAIQRQSHVTSRPPVQQQSFKDQFQLAALQATADLKISKHAKQRMEERDIKIEPSQWLQLRQKVREAKNMGIQESLVITKEAAFIISAKNNTVITAMNRKEAQSQIFSNINGTIVLE